MPELRKKGRNGSLISGVMEGTHLIVGMLSYINVSVDGSSSKAPLRSKHDNASREALLIFLKMRSRPVRRPSRGIE